jgi:hypothetical protein
MRPNLRTRSLILLLLAAIVLLLITAPLSASSAALSFWALFFLPALFFIEIHFHRASPITGSILDTNDGRSPVSPPRFQRLPPISIA